MAPPRKPSFTESVTKKEGSSGDAKTVATPLLEDIDKMSPEQLAEYLYALAEEIIASPKEYKIKMGLEQLDIHELDNIDTTTPEGRRKLAKLFRLLAAQVLKSKEIYQASVVDPSKDQGRRR